jgi:hypothetical protein
LERMGELPEVVDHIGADDVDVLIQGGMGLST